MSSKALENLHQQRAEDLLRGLKKTLCPSQGPPPLDSIKVIRVDFVECLLQISFLLLSQSIMKEISSLELVSK